MSKKRLVEKLSKQLGKSFEFVGFEQLESVASHCENCQHPIAALYFLRHRETGNQIRVGSECVLELLTDGQEITFENTRARARRAVDQLRRGNPPPKPGETPAQYINRRVMEQANALKAHHDWTSLLAQYENPADLVSDRLKKKGIRNPDFDFFSRNQTPEQIEARRLARETYESAKVTEWAAVIAEHEEKYKANYYDFNQMTWQVNKL